MKDKIQEVVSMNVYGGFDKELRLDGKTAIVTGGASGIGNSTAKLLAEKGASVFLLDRDETVKEKAKEINGAHGITLDITKTEEVKEAVSYVIKESDRIDILCNIAGVGSGTMAEEISEEEYLNVINVNLNGSFFMAQAAGKEMIRAGNGGRIINMASQAGVVALPGHVAYSTSKAGVLAVTRSLAQEWGKYGITCNAISPTVVLTPMSRDYWSGERGAAHLAQIPTGRFAEMDEVAMAFVYLASDAAAMINGANLVIDGGFTIG